MSDHGQLPVDEYHRISLTLRRLIAADVAELRSKIAEWTLPAYHGDAPPPSRTDTGRAPYLDELRRPRPWLR